VKKVFFLVLFTFLLTTLNAQSSKLQLDLEESIEIALENNNSYKQALYKKQIAEEQVREAYGTSLFPSIDGNVSYIRALEIGETFIEGFGTIKFGTDNTLNAGLTLEQPLFTGAMFLAVKIAKTFEDIQNRNVQYSKSELIVNVTEAYYNILLAEELVSLTELNLELADQNLKNAQTMYKAGLVSEYDELKAKVQYQNITPALTETKNQLRLAKNNLRLLLGIELDTEIDVKEKLNYAPGEELSFELGKQMLEENNQLLKQIELDVNLKDLTKSYRFSEHFPKLNLTGSLQAQALGNGPVDVLGWKYSRSINIGLNLSVPIFKGFSIDSQVEQADIDLKISKEELTKVKRQLQSQLENSLLGIKKTKEQVSAYELAVTEAERGYEISQKRYGTGLASQLEVTSALLDFTQAKVNYLTSVRDYYVFSARLDHLLGNYSNQIN
jgi:outer membrane protein TolC